MPSSGTDSDSPVPHRELELKATVADPEDLARRLLAAGAELLFQGSMEDRRYDRGNELTARDEVLRTRLLRGKNSRESVLGWKGPTRLSPEGYKLREELEYPVLGGAAADPLLLALGYSVVHSIHREITVFRLGQATVRVERYPRMDVLVEVEGTPQDIERAIEASGIPRRQFMADSLAEFVTRFEQRTGQRALVARET
jgi:adenylate cyclase class IV